MFSTYKPEDVVLLLKDITGQVKPMVTEERERLIQGGHHYSEMLPLEYEPTKAYLQAYFEALKRYAGITAEAVARVSDKIYQEKGPGLVLVSLARAGTPIGILIKHYLKQNYHVDVVHYTLSIIRGLGIDQNAMAYILARHAPEAVQFVDGWTGKGAIQRELQHAMQAYPNVSPDLAVLSDPAHIAGKWGTHQDFLIASSCLNATVSGLLSRTFLRSDIIGPDDFHGAAFYQGLQHRDLTYSFISAIEEKFPAALTPCQDTMEADGAGIEEVKKIAVHFAVRDLNLVKPGIGETTRVLLRRLPWKILVYRLDDQERLGHLYQLAKEKDVEVVEYPLQHYLACGLIQSLGDT